MSADTLAPRRLELLTVQEFASLIRVHPVTIYQRIRDHRQPGVYRFGRDIRIDLTVALAAAAHGSDGLRGV